MSRPLVFISHKHSDRAIAGAVRAFITENTVGNTPVFQSSDPAALTPGVGRTLNAELRKALWDAGAVILIYTSPDQEWAYCMWECGVATVPNSPDTRIVLLQCGDSAPSLFAGQTNVLARDRASVGQFVTQFMTAPDFLPRSGGPLTGYHAESDKVTQATDRFFDNLQLVLPEGPVAERAEYPFLELQLPSPVIKAVTDAPVDHRPGLARKAVMSETAVCGSDGYAPALFGLTEFAKGSTLQDLYGAWRATSPGRSDAWVDALADQVARAVQGQLPALRWITMLSAQDGRPHVPILARVRKFPALATHQFDVYFYPFDLLDATPVLGTMRRRSDMFCRVVEPGAEGEVNVMQLIQDLETHRHGRIPFVDGGDRLVYIAHRSMLDQFVARQILRRGPGDLMGLTLADLFRDEPHTKAMFAGTAAFVGCQATLADAKAAMGRVVNCYDVFVTDSGLPHEPVLGWLTDVRLAGTGNI